MRYLVREKLFSIGDDFWIEDEEGRRAFYVDGKVLRIRETLAIQDPQGRELAVIHKKLLSVRDAMTVERDGETLVSVRKKMFTPFHESFRAELASGEELEIRGDIVDKEYDIEYGDERLARAEQVRAKGTAQHSRAVAPRSVQQQQGISPRFAGSFVYIFQRCEFHNQLIGVK